MCETKPMFAAIVQEILLWMLIIGIPGVGYAVEEGFLHVETDPPGAVVYLDRSEFPSLDSDTSDLGMDTFPEEWLWQFDMDAVSASAIRLSKETANTWILTIADENQAYLVKARDGKLSIHKMLGRTPLSCSVDSGSYKIHIEKQFYEPIVLTVFINKKKLSRVKPIPLKLKRGRGDLTVVSSPLGAEIYLNGIKQEQKSPVEIKNLEAGEYELHLIRGDHFWYEKAVRVEANETTVVNAQLIRDTNAPGEKRIRFLQINDGKQKTPSRDVLITLHVWDETGIQEVGVANDLDFTDAQWHPLKGDRFIGSLPWSLKPGEGPRTIYIKLKDHAGNISKEPLQRRIWLTPPFAMILIEPGKGQTIRKPDDTAAVRTIVDLERFYIDRYEVTNEQYKTFIDATNYPAPPHWKNRHYPFGQRIHPVVNVSFGDAREYARWAGKRLPTVAEWEYAALGLGGKRWPWGNAWNGIRGNVVDLNTGQGILPVNVLTKDSDQAWTVYGMSGNVWEWVIREVSKSEEEIQELPVLRGGAFFKEEDSQMSTAWEQPPYHPERATWIGFRCVKDVGDSTLSVQ